MENKTSVSEKRVRAGGGALIMRDERNWSKSVCRRCHVGRGQEVLWSAASFGQGMGKWNWSLLCTKCTWCFGHTKERKARGVFKRRHRVASKILA